MNPHHYSGEYKIMNISFPSAAIALMTLMGAEGRGVRFELFIRVNVTIILFISLARIKYFQNYEKQLILSH